MNIVLIHGQNHKGSSYHIGHMTAEKIAGENKITEFFLPKDLPHFCTGCYRCIEDERKCPCDAEKRVIMDKVEQADLLIFTTPTYCMHVSAPMKAFIDLTFTYWMVHKPRACMFGKRALIVSTAAGMGTKTAIKDVRTALEYWGIPSIRTYGISVQASCWEQVSRKNKEIIDRDTSRLAKLLSICGKPHIPMKTKMLFAVMRMMQQKDWGSGPKEKAYWQQQGWLEQKRPWKS